MPPPHPIQLVPAGWYPNPRGPGYRWWDGQRWSDMTSAAPPFTGPAPGRKSGNLRRPAGLLVGGALLAVLGASYGAGAVGSLGLFALLAGGMWLTVALLRG
jgi:hypothetical protein